MHDYWIEFGKVAIAHLLAVASPGPDFAIVLKQSLVHGRRTAVWTSLGIGTGILLHVTYCLFGLALLITGSVTWFNVAKYLGAAYLAWMGVQALRAKPRDEAVEPAARATPKPHGAFMTGFLTNTVGNPKAALFFLALFSVVIDPHTPRLVQAAYGAWMAVATAAWFSFVSFAFTQDVVRRRFLRHGHWIDRALGVVFLGFAVSLLLSVATPK
ncbi:LysE family transporter [Opitutus sp. ER46]|uniref:LysE family translocator n=1 Tax=Opitutus sp. ER46 TaxID=2161864 RepID=UPI000D3057F8|nr:LysE family transporter [Opitutus sp. ER46]PTX90753.1 lysine transporter LysE [Opitutus sp. ER46]